jgi:AAA domain
MSPLCSEPLSQVRFENIRWLWEGFLPRGRLALLDGNPGVGKSLITIDLAARLSRGGPLPNGTPAGRPHVTLLLGVEDHTADTIRPRAEAAGADLDRVHIVSGSGEPILFPDRIPALEELIRARSADLVVIDPVLAFLPPEVAANLDQCVRRAMNPLAALAERTDCAILLVRHLRKTGSILAVHRGQGSMGIIAAARTGWLAARHPEDPTLGVLAVTKSNVAGNVPSLGYRIQSGPLAPRAEAGTARGASGPHSGAPVVEWTEAVSLSADKLGDQEAPLRMRDRAIAWLHAALASGPRTATNLYAAAAEANIPEKTLLRAKSDLGAKSTKVHSKDRSEWYWYDPAAPWPKDAPFRQPNPNELPPLEDSW